MLMNTSRLVFFWISCFSLSTSVPLRPMMIPAPHAPRAAQQRPTHPLGRRSPLAVARRHARPAAIAADSSSVARVPARRTQHLRGRLGAPLARVLPPGEGAADVLAGHQLGDEPR